MYTVHLIKYTRNIYFNHRGHRVKIYGWSKVDVKGDLQLENETETVPY